MTTMCETIDEFNTFIVGKSKQELQSAIYDAIRKRRSFVRQLLQIHKLDQLSAASMLYILVLHHQIDCVMFMMDTYNITTYDDWVGSYLVSETKIPESYITKYIHSCGPKSVSKEVYHLIGRRYPIKRMMVFIHSFDWDMQFDIAQRSVIDKITTKCLFVCALEHIDELDVDDIELLIEYFEQYIIDDVVSVFYINVLCKIADKFPLTIYKHIYLTYINYPHSGLARVMKYAIGLLSTELLCANLPDAIANLEHYYMFIDANVSMIKLIPVIMRSISGYYKHTEFEAIIEHMYVHGNSIFKHIDVDSMQNYIFIKILTFALDFQHDPSAIEMMQSIKCVKKIARAHFRGHNDILIVDRVLEI